MKISRLSILCLIIGFFSYLELKASDTYKYSNISNYEYLYDSIIDSIDSLNADFNLLDTEVDTISINKEISKQIDLNIENKQWIPNSKHALLWALLPGGGQIYNRKYWKLPIVWGSFTACIYAFRFNQKKYTEYHEAYRDISSEDPSQNTAWLAFTPRGTKASDYQKYSYLKSTFQRGDEYFRRWRDISIVTSIAVYGLSILDAYVDAELYTFDISEDLSMRIYPEINTNNFVGVDNMSFSLGCSVYF